jgi:hypothetical protein
VRKYLPFADDPKATFGHWLGLAAFGQIAFHK